MSPRHIARYRVKDGRVYYGIVDGDLIRRLEGTPYESVVPCSVVDSLTDVVMLCPVEMPRLFAVGMNYKGHIAEAKARTPAVPQVFMMPSTAAVGPGEAIVLPFEAQIVHHECELAVVIGRKGRRISQDQALSYVLGYTCANDVSERVIQQSEMALGCLFVGKAFDTFCPLGPTIATGIDPSNLSISTSVNGVVKQSGNTSDLLFGVDYIVSYLSQAVTLLPGDVILTGTPSGVSVIKPGDLCVVEISGVGALTNPVKAEVN